jgi:putative endopeptidase
MRYSNNYRTIILGVITYLLVFNNNYSGAQSIRTINNKSKFGDWGVETQFISSKVLPGDDFYRFVNEGWLITKTIPSVSSGLSNYSEVKKIVSERIADLITKKANGQTSSKPLQQVKTLYQGYVDTAQIEILGIRSIEQEVKHILSIKSHASIAKWMADPNPSLS